MSGLSNCLYNLYPLSPHLTQRRAASDTKLCGMACKTVHKRLNLEACLFNILDGSVKNPVDRRPLGYPVFSRYEPQRPDIGGDIIPFGTVLARPEAKKRRKGTSKWRKLKWYANVKIIAAYLLPGPALALQQRPTPERWMLFSAK